MGDISTKEYLEQYEQGSLIDKSSDIIILKQFIHYTLQQEVNFFGKIIPKGALFVQVNEDWWHPVFDSKQHPSMAVDFSVVRNNPEYFLQIIGG
jgi:hypothetical protein